MTDPVSPSHYTSYLLRVWRVDGERRCRALLEEVATGERVGFGDLAGLLTFLEAQMPEAQEKIEAKGFLANTD